MKSLKNMPESLETMTDSDQLRPLFWSLRRCFDLFVDKHKRAFSLVEKCRVIRCCQGVVHDHAKLTKEDDYYKMVKIILCSILFHFLFKS